MLGDIFWALLVAGGVLVMLHCASLGLRLGEPPPDLPPPPDLEECPLCGRRVADLGYHRRRCRGTSRPFRHSEIVRGFRRRERQDRT